jgi:hypothetical protein
MLKRVLTRKSKAFKDRSPFNETIDRPVINNYLLPANAWNNGVDTMLACRMTAIIAFSRACAGIDSLDRHIS